MNQQTTPLVLRANKTWAISEAILGVLFIYYTLFVLNGNIPKVILVALSIFILVQAYINWNASITIAGTELVSKFWRTKSVNLSELTYIRSGSIMDGGGNGLTLSDKKGQQTLLMTRLYRKQDVVSVLTHIQPYFPEPVSSMSRAVQSRLKEYGIN